jgi:oligopeptide transport system permease protein
LGWFNVIPDWNEPIRPWILPTLTLGMSTMAFITRLTRASVLEVKRQDYIRTARAKGLADLAVNTRHILRNAVLPIVTIMGPLLAGLITGAFFTELIFQIPGMGNVLLTSIAKRDYSMIMGLALFYSFLLTTGNLLVDLAYGVVDPRISVK